ncbi:hypothetical protein SELMODRAFT_418110 [Selaginella moellendorffii]|uniref:Uncharacterized protein n=1 Tax=Selaginella moellendorffii TaxID=88036 RepID=D8S4Q1_SELML|nr:hypothetical protein SELMODRAFT_418110 [Selaginella moellendorffii]
MARLAGRLVQQPRQLLVGRRLLRWLALSMSAASTAGAAGCGGLGCGVLKMQRPCSRCAFEPLDLCDPTVEERGEGSVSGPLQWLLLLQRLLPWQILALDQKGAKSLCGEFVVPDTIQGSWAVGNTKEITVLRSQANSQTLSGSEHLQKKSKYDSGLNHVDHWIGRSDGGEDAGDAAHALSLRFQSHSSTG